MKTSRTVKAHKRNMLKQTMAGRVEVVVMVVLLAVALAHLLRLITGAELRIDETVIPLWVSVFGCLGPAALAGLFWWSHH